MEKGEILGQIVGYVVTAWDADFSIWRVGLTHDPGEMKKYHEEKGRSTEHWKQWKTDTVTDAQHIRFYLTRSKGMQESTSDELDARRPVYVYIF